jgi:osmotically inducible protein OsmC
MAGKTSSAQAAWVGGGKDGRGALTTQSNTITNLPFTAAMRFADASGTNPEELIAAAHASCFTMALAFALSAAGHTADELQTDAVVTIINENGGWRIASVALELNGRVPGISEQDFRDFAEGAKNNCPVSKVLKAEISLTMNFG